MYNIRSQSHSKRIKTYYVPQIPSHSSSQTAQKPPSVTVMEEFHHAVERMEWGQFVSVFDSTIYNLLGEGQYPPPSFLTEQPTPPQPAAYSQPGTDSQVQVRHAEVETGVRVLLIKVFKTAGCFRLNERKKSAGTLLYFTCMSLWCEALLISKLNYTIKTNYG